MKNPFPQYEGFRKRVNFAQDALARYGADSHYDIFTRSFDDCFENHDGDAVFFALRTRTMKTAQNGDDLLLKGMKKVFGDNPAAWGSKYVAEQLSLF